jgi:hypothetical protein
MKRTQLTPCRGKGQPEKVQVDVTRSYNEPKHRCQLRVRRAIGRVRVLLSAGRHDRRQGLEGWWWSRSVCSTCPTCSTKVEQVEQPSSMTGRRERPRVHPSHRPNFLERYIATGPVKIRACMGTWTLAPSK